MNLKAIFALLFLNILSQTSQAQERWSETKIKLWHDNQAWMLGCNYIPYNAINQLEMWQKETFDTLTISKELKMAHEIGFNTLRVFLHTLLWENDSLAFAKRINIFLNISERNQIKVAFVLFDNCWLEEANWGKQPVPKQGIHNSGWLQCPGKKRLLDSTTWSPLEKYTKGIMRLYQNDKRVVLWDLYNEPCNSGYQEKALPLLKKVFSWA